MQFPLLHFHPMKQIEVVSRKFSMVTTRVELTRLESELSFSQVRSTMTLQEKIRQVKCQDMQKLQADRPHEPGENRGC